MSGAFEDAHKLAEMVDQFFAARNITYQQYQALSQFVLADGNIDEHERQQINRLFDAIQTGRIKVTD